MQLFKTCPDCKIDRPIADFGNNAQRPDGLQFYCRQCCRRRGAETYRRKRERQGKPVRDRPLVPDGHKYCPDCKTVKPRAEWHRATRSHDGLGPYCKSCSAERNRRGYLRRTFGLDDASLRAMLDEQGGRCAICRDDAPQHIDHDHATGEIRGVLCSKCNMGLGLFDDDPARLDSAIRYLRRPRYTQPLEVEEYEPPGPIYVDFRVGHRAA